MRERNIQGASRRKAFKTTMRDEDARPAPDLVNRKFRRFSAPDQLWVADITYIPTLAGFLFLAVVFGVLSRRVVGWAMANAHGAEVVLDALNMAIHERKPKHVIHHSDQGWQYTSFHVRCKGCGQPAFVLRWEPLETLTTTRCARASSPRSSASCSSSVDFRHKAAALNVFEYLEGFYNPRRRHSSLDYISPMEFEQRSSQSRLMSNEKLSAKAGQLQTYFT